jgi:hypothetical protein
MKLIGQATRAAVVTLLVLSAFALASSPVLAQAGSTSAPAKAARTVEAAVARSSAPSAATLRPAAGAPALSGLRATAASPVIFSEGFEGTLASWQVSGTPTWGTTTYRAAAGQASAYCAQSTIPAPGPYADDMSAWLKAGPFDLSKVSAASLTYKMYLQCEAGVDQLLCLVSLNGTNWYGWATTGDYAGWIDRNRNLAAITTIGSVCGKSQVWIAFKFESDASATEEGAYIDDLKLTDETPPSVTSMTPSSGNVGSTVTLTGAGLAGVTAVSFNGVAAQFTTQSAAQITATVPAGATTGPVSLTSPYGTAVCSTSFTVTVPPTITSLTPGAGVVGASVTVQGTDLGGATKVSFAGVSAAYRVDSAAQLTAVVPAGATTGAVEVTTPGGVATSATSFVILVKPQLTRVSATSAKRGATVTLTGKGFGARGSTSYVKFGAKKSTKVVSWSETRIQCKVPAKAKFGKLKVTVVTAGGTSAAKTFKVKH